MFGPFRVTNPLSGGLLWKTPWRLSKFQKRRQRLRLRAVDNVVATLDAALAKKGERLESLERWKAEMPTEAEMLPRDKYTIFDRKVKGYRKGIHSKSFPRPLRILVVWKIVLGRMLMLGRAAEVDEGFAENQPARLLRRAEAEEDLEEAIVTDEQWTTRLAALYYTRGAVQRGYSRGVELVQYLIMCIYGSQVWSCTGLQTAGCGKHRHLQIQSPQLPYERIYRVIAHEVPLRTYAYKF